MPVHFTAEGTSAKQVSYMVSVTVAGVDKAGLNNPVSKAMIIGGSFNILIAIF